MECYRKRDERDSFLPWKFPSVKIAGVRKNSGRRSGGGGGNDRDHRPMTLTLQMMDGKYDYL